MKTFIYTLIFLIISLTSVGQKHRAFNSCPYETDVKTFQFTVLDINYEKKIVAFKHVYKLQRVFISGEEEGQEPVNCKYAGMEKYPNAGVVLGIYDVEKGEYLKTFTIYQSCFNIEDCYDHEFSSKSLDSAKLLFEEYELDINKKPKPKLFSEKSKDSFKITVNGINFYSTFENDYSNGLTTSYLYAEGKLLYSVEYDDYFAMASRGEIFYISAYTKGDKIIFLNKFYHENHMEGPICNEYYHFTPVFIKKNNEVILEKP